MKDEVAINLLKDFVFIIMYNGFNLKLQSLYKLFFYFV